LNVQLFTMCAGFRSHVGKKHIHTVLTVTTGPLRANIMLIWPSMKMSLTPLQCSRMSESRD